MMRPANIDRPWGVSDFTWVSPNGCQFAKDNRECAEAQRLYALQIEAELDRFRVGTAKAEPALRLTVQDVTTIVDARIGEWIDWSRIDLTIEDKVRDKYLQARLEILDGDKVGINFRPNGRRELPASDIVLAALRDKP